MVFEAPRQDFEARLASDSRPGKRGDFLSTTSLSQAAARVSWLWPVLMLMLALALRSRFR